MARRRGRLAAACASLGLLAAATPAAAQTVLQLDGTANLNYTVATPRMGDRADLFLELRPGITFQTGSPSLVFRVSYLFVGTLALDGSWNNTYSNQLAASLALQPDDRSTLTLAGTVIQGDTAFLISQRPADAGQPTFLPPGSPAQINGTLVQTFLWEATPELRLNQSLTGQVVAPQYALNQSNSSITGRVALDRVEARDSYGGEFYSTVARLRRTTEAAEPFWSLINSLLGHWTRDLDQGWSASASAGLASVVTFTEGTPSAVVPAANLTGRYVRGSAGGALSLDVGPLMDLQTGTVSQNASATARWFVDFEALWPRQLSGSLGYRHSWPIGNVTPGSAAGLGDAIQADLGFLWGLSDSALLTARYSLAYQFAQPGDVAPSLIHVLLVGITGRWSNAAYLPPMPSAGQRVDGSDGVPFPGAEPRRP